MVEGWWWSAGDVDQGLVVDGAAAVAGWWSRQQPVLRFVFCAFFFPFLSLSLFFFFPGLTRERNKTGKENAKVAARIVVSDTNLM